MNKMIKNTSAPVVNGGRSGLGKYRVMHRLFATLVCLGTLSFSAPQSLFAQKSAQKQAAVKQKMPVSKLPHWPETAVYLPLDQLDALMTRDRSGVLLSRAQYEKLKKQAEVNAGGTGLPDTRVIVYGAAYEATISERQLIINAKISIRQFPQSLTVVSLPLTGLAVESAQLNGQPAMIARGEGQQPVLQLFSQTAGEHQLELRFSAPLNTVGSDQVSQFKLLSGVPSQFKIKVPVDRHLVVNDLKVKSSSQDGKLAAYEFPVGGDGQVSIRITEQSQQQANDSLVFARSGIGVSVSPGKVAWQAQTTLNIYGQALDRVLLSVPQSLEIVSVESTGLESWALNDSMRDRGRTEITLNYRQPIEGERQIICRGVMTTEADEDWDVPDLFIEKVNSHVGSVLIRYPPGVRLQIEKTRNVRRKAQESITPRKKSAERQMAGPGFDFDFWQEDFRISLITQEKRSEVQMASSTVVDINEQGMDLRLVTTVESLFAPMFEFQMKIPAEWTILGATFKDQQIDWKESSREAGTKLIRLPFPGALPANQEARVIIDAHRDLENWPPETEGQLLNLPEIELPQAKILEGTLVINAEDDWDLVPSELSGLEPMPERIPKMRFGYQYQDNNYSGSLTVSRKPLQMAAHHLQYVRLDQTTLFSHYEATLNVERGSFRSLMVALPESVGTNLQFRLLRTAGRIIEQAADEPQNGVRVWRLKMDRRLSGKQILTVTVEQPRKSGEVVQVPQLQIMSADRQYGEVAFEAEGDQRLEIKATGVRGQLLSSIDAAELPVPIAYQPRERIVAAYRFVGAGHQIQVQETRFDQTAIPTAIAHQLDIKSVLGSAGEVQNEASLIFSAVGIQSLQVTLPEGSELLSAQIGGTPVEVRQTGSAFIIPVTADSQSDGTHILKLLYDANRSNVEWKDQLSATPPQVSVVDGAGQIQPLQILNQAWVILYPKDTFITNSKGDFLPEQPLGRPGMIERVRQRLSVVPVRDIGGRVIAASFVLLIAVISVFVYRRGGANVVVSLFIGFILLCVVVTLMLPAVQQSREAARRSESKNELRQLELSMHNYFDSDAQVEFRQGSAENPTPMAAPAPGFEKSEQADGLARTMSEPASESERLRRLQGAIKQSEDAKFKRQAGGMQGKPTSAGVMGEMAQPQAELPPPAKALGGRLSVVAPLPEPRGYRSLAFQYYGEPVEKGLTLDVSLQALKSSRRLFLVVLVGVLWLGWLLRSRSCLQRCLALLIGIFLPVSCSAFLPAGVQPILDGIFAGSLLVGFCWSVEWLLCKLARKCCHWCCPAESKQVTVTTLLLLGLFLGAPVNGFAQPKVKPPVPKLPQNLVIPYDAGTDPLSSQRIFLPQSEFKKLWNAAHPEQPVDQQALSTGTVSQALYAAELNPGAEPGQAVVHVTGRLVIHTVGQQPVTMAVPLGKSAISSAQLDGKSATLLTHPEHLFSSVKAVSEHFYSIVIPKAGLHILDLEFDLPAQQSGTAGSFKIDLNAVASGRLTLGLPEASSQVSVTGTRATYRKQTVAGKTTLELPIDQGGYLQISWRPAEERGAIQGIIHCDTNLSAIVQDAGLRLHSVHQYHVRQGTINQALLKVPEDIRIQSVTGPDVGGWEIVGTGEERRIKVFFRRDIKDTTQISLMAFQSLSVGKQNRSLSLPQFVPENITNETGTLGVYSEPQFQIRPEKITGAIQIDTQKFVNPESGSPVWKVSGQSLQPQWAYRFSRRPVETQFFLSRKQPEKQAVAEHAVFVTPRKMSLSSRIRYQLKGIPESTFVMELPESYLVLNVQAQGLDDWYVIEQNADDMRVLVLEFAELKTNLAEIVVDGVIPRQGNQQQAEVMMPTPLVVSSVRSDLAIWVDESLVARASELDDWRAISSADLSPELKGQRPRLPQFAYRSTAELPEWIKLELTPAQPNVTANSLVMTTVGNVSVSHTVGIQWSIQGAATDLLSFTTPAWLGEHLDFRGDSIRQINKRVIGNEIIQWTIHLQNSVEGTYFITAETTQAPPVDGKIEIPQVRVMNTSIQVDSQTTELETQQHYFMLVNHSWARLNLLNPESISPVDREEMPLKLDDTLANQAMTLARLLASGKSPVYQIQQFQADQGAAAAVNLSQLTTVLAHDGSWKTHANYRLRNRSRQFLAIRLPENSRVLSAFVKGVPTAPVLLKQQTEKDENAPKNHETYLLALPKTSAADLSFSVDLIIAGRLAAHLPQGAFNWQGKTIDLDPPRIITPAENAEYGIPVAQTKWAVYVPNDYSATPLLDDPRTNMSLVLAESDYSKVDASMSSVVKDVENLYSVYSGSKSDRVRKRVIDNLKQLELKLDNAPQTQLEGQGERIKQQITDLQRKEQQRQAQKDKMLSYSANTNGVADFDSEEAFNQLVTGNNASLYKLNRAPTAQTQESEVDLFQGPLTPPQLKSFTIRNVKPQDLAEKKGGQKAPTDSRALRRQQSLQNANDFGLPQLGVQQQQAMPNQAPAPEGQGGAGGMGGGFPNKTREQVTKEWKDRFKDREASNRSLRDSKEANVWNQLNDVEEALSDAYRPDLRFGRDKKEWDELTKRREEDRKQVSQQGKQQSSQQAGWTQAGGISLKFDIPLQGHKLEFSKVNGHPKLALKVRPENTFAFGSALVWTIVWGAVLICLILFVTRFSNSAFLWKWGGMALTLAGLAGWLFLTGWVGGFALICFLLGAICLSSQWMKRTA
ncbi:hypothetical protein Enr10x_54760 [Gimesia panareensis]|uniref:Uncharacterized protein n=2 Tax=Gimesia panareensis TaxID=2527978 RepID=A0A517QEP3_9PLAN|nr:hypothetical protein Enr10x_54760 [Gimesia panareensis]